MELKTEGSAPIIKFIVEAQAAFVATYNMQAERIHCSRSFAKALVRWVTAQYAGSVPQGEGVEVCGLEVVHMTKQSPHFEFHLSATRDGQHFTSHVRLMPDHPAEGLIQEMEGVVDLTIPGEDEDDALELLASDSEDDHDENGGDI